MCTMTENENRIDGKKIDTKFQPGNPGGPGRPKRQTEASYLSAMLDAVPLEKWKRICERAATDALAGDDKARGWLAKYLVGEPATKAATPLQVVVQQMIGSDQALDRAAHELAQPILERELFPSLHVDNAREDRVKAQMAAKLLEAENNP
jgi:hypothetical protein